MFHICNIRTRHAALGTALLTIVAGCSDVPSGLRRPVPGPLAEEGPVGAVADRPLVEGTALNLLAGEHQTTRTLRRPDGHEYQVDVARSSDGLAREMLVRRDGVPMVRMVNDWRAVAGGHIMTRQRLVEFAASAQPVVFDTRTRGGVEAFLGSPFTVSMRSQPVRSSRSLGDVTRAGRTLTIYDEYGDPSSGPCDGAARTVDSALEDWLLSVAATAGATMTGNVWGAWMAYGYQLKKYRDLTRADAALDDCVAKAD
jgi:hypothetical protein